VNPTRSSPPPRRPLRRTLPPAAAASLLLLAGAQHDPARAQQPAAPAASTQPAPDADAAVRAAVRADDVAGLRAALARGGHAEQGRKFGVTLLMEAAEKGPLGATEALLVAGADPVAINSFDETALVYAVRGGNAQVVARLLAAGSDVNHSSEHGFSPLIVAVGTGRLDLVRQLLAAGAKPDQPAEGGATPLMFAAFHGHVAIAEALLAAGARLDAEDEFDRDALQLAADGRDPETIRFFERKTGRKAPVQVVAAVGSAAGDLREIDFRNFRYVLDGRTVEVRDGSSVAALPPEGATGGDAAAPAVRSVSVTMNDLTGDGRPEAAVLLDVRLAAGDRRTPVIVFGLRDGKLVELARLPDAPAAPADPVTAIGIDRGELTIVRTAPGGERTTSRWRLTAAGLEPAPATTR
jgi:Ankyrin repeats (3 copies)/Ankyrin repeat